MPVKGNLQESFSLCPPCPSGRAWVYLRMEPFPWAASKISLQIVMWTPGQEASGWHLQRGCTVGKAARFPACFPDADIRAVLHSFQDHQVPEFCSVTCFSLLCLIWFDPFPWYHNGVCFVLFLNFSVSISFWKKLVYLFLHFVKHLRLWEDQACSPRVTVNGEKLN